MKIRKTRTSNALKILSALFLLAVMAACQSSVSGMVFIDHNQNGRIDEGEPGIPFAKLSVTRDNEVVAENYTDAAGAFLIPIKQRPGYVCIEADFSFAEAKLQMLLDPTGKELPAKALRVSPPPKTLTVPHVSAKTFYVYDEEEEVQEEETYTVETPKPAGPQGWVGSKYCKEIKYKGFEVDIPVTMDFTEALSVMPKRLPVTCYAGDSCVVRLVWPQGCMLRPLALPRGLSLDDSEQSGVESYDHTFNLVTFSDVTLVPSESPKTQAGIAMPAATGFETLDLKLRTSDSIEFGKTEDSIEVQAVCMDQQLELDPIPVELIREVDVAVYQHLITQLSEGGSIESGSDVKVMLKIVNRARSSVSKGELVFIPPTGSVLHNVPGCYNYGTKLICPVDRIEGDSEFKKTVSFKLPQSDYQTNESCEASFKAPGMEGALSADTVTFLVKVPEPPPSEEPPSDFLEVQPWFPQQ